MLRTCSKAFSFFAIFSFCLFPRFAWTQEQTGMRVAVVDLSAPSSIPHGEVAQITDVIRSIVTKNLPPVFDIMTKPIIEALVPSDQRARCFGENCLLELGKILQARYIIGGEIRNLQERAKIGVTIEAYDVKAGKLLCTEPGDAGNLNEVTQLIQSMTEKLVSCFLERTGFQAPTTVPITKGKAVDETPHIVLKPKKVTLPKDWEAKTAILFVQSEPEGATVYLDGERVGTTPFQKLDVPVGTHHLFVEHGELYFPFEWTGRIPVEGLKKQITLEPNFCRLVIRSNPKGAQCKLSGIDIGTTPITIEQQKAGKYTVECTYPHYFPEREDIECAPKKEKDVELVLKESVGSLRIWSEPSGARIYMDGKALGATTEYIIKVDPGLHEIRLELEGYEPYEEQVSVEIGKESKVGGKLAEIYGGIKIVAELGDVGGPKAISDVDVYIDGVLKGKTPLQEKVLAKRHTVKVVYKGLEQQDVVLVPARATITKTFVFKSKELQELEKLKEAKRRLVLLTWGSFGARVGISPNPGFDRWIVGLGVEVQLYYFRTGFMYLIATGKSEGHNAKMGQALFPLEGQYVFDISSIAYLTLHAGYQIGVQTVTAPNLGGNYFSHGPTAGFNLGLAPGVELWFRFFTDLSGITSHTFLFSVVPFSFGVPF